MTYAVTALTADGGVDVRSTSITTIRMALADVRAQNATNVSLSKDGKTIDETQLGQTTTTSTTSVGAALANSAAGKAASAETYA